MQSFGVSIGSLPDGTLEISSIGSAIKSSSLPWIEEAFENTLSKPLATVIHPEPTSTTLGLIWLGLSQFLLSLYVTNIPIDPAVRRILLGEVIATRIALLEEERDAIAANEIRAKGIPESRRLDDTISRLSALQSEQASLGSSASRYSDVTRLNVLFNEVHSFMSDAMDKSAVDALASSLHNNEKQAAQREEGFQAVTSALIHRLEKNYSDMDDLIQPIISAVLFAKFGLRCLARDLQLRHANPQDLVKGATSFPSITLSPVNAKSTDILSQVLAAASLATNLDTSVQRRSSILDFVARLDDLYATWSAIRLREQREAQEADSLYRVKKTDVEVLSDVEQEEKEFKELFPTFEGVGDETDNVVSTKKPEDEEEEVKGKFAQERILAFHRLVTTVFGAGSVESIYTSSLDQLLHSFNMLAYDEHLDESSLAFQITQLHRRKSETGSSAKHPNFYTAANEVEIRKGHAILVKLSSRLSALIEEWPEQMVLQHILDRVERVLLLDVRSPVALVLSALEGVMVHTDDWESYANKENSLKEYQSAISDLIISWRRLELASWMRLLDDQLTSYVNGDSEWTLRLYGALIHGSLSSKNADDHIKTVLPLLKDYLSASTFGHFAPRLDVLRSFEGMAKELAELTTDSEQQQALTKIAKMLHNTITNYTLFAPRIADSLASQRATLDKSIKDFVKLASWKDVNVYALKASAVKSHRQLHRSIRKFREVLQQPISPVLADLNSLCPQEAAVVSPTSAVMPVEVQGPTDLAINGPVIEGSPEHLIKLDKTFDRFAQVFASANDKSGERTSIASDLDGLAVDVIETVQELAKATPSSLTEENKKIVNNLASRKRKAFSDLLKVLRSLGFSNNVRADQLTQQKDANLCANLPSFIENADLGVDAETIKRIEAYHAKTGVLVLALREAFNGHNDDINSQDLERGIGFVESVYASSINQRDR